MDKAKMVYTLQVNVIETVFGNFLKVLHMIGFNFTSEINILCQIL